MLQFMPKIYTFQQHVQDGKLQKFMTITHSNRPDLRETLLW